MKTISLSKSGDWTWIHVYPSAPNSVPEDWSWGHEDQSVIVTEVKTLSKEQKAARNNEPLLILRTTDPMVVGPDELIHIGRILQKIGREKKNGIL